MLNLANDDAESDDDDYDSTPEQLAADEVDRWQKFKPTMNVGLSDVMTLWRHVQVQKAFPLLTQVAFAVFGHPTSAGGIERDFGIASVMLTSKRSLTDAAFAEMVLFMRANLNLVPRPENIPIIADDEITTHIPCRLRTMADIQAVQMLSQYAADDLNAETQDVTGAGDTANLDQLIADVDSELTHEGDEFAYDA